MRCTYPECCSKAVIIVGHCKYCQLDYCNHHRLPEDHMCVELSKAKQMARDLNTNQLLKNKTIEKKIADI
jgi:predicted nucleic acid binding AN1-type Zn finger protein